MEIRYHEPMSRHTTFKAGGEADRFLIPETEEEFAAAVRELRAGGEEFYIIGNGSNLLVSDAGFRGTIVSTERLDGLTELPEGFRAGAGVLLSRLAKAAARRGLTGLEFAGGIPGTVGGAVLMNAGAYGFEMKDVLVRASVLAADGTVCGISLPALALSYRSSILMENGGIVLAAEFALKEGSEDAIRARMAELSDKRREKQPLEYPSAGSTFKRPEGYFAGRLIEDAGLKGFSVGGASVSEKHAGFVINRDHASASEIYALCREVQRRVYEKSGVRLELEVRLVGEF